MVGILFILIGIVWLFVLASEARYFFAASKRAWLWHVPPLLWTIICIWRFTSEGQEARALITPVGFAMITLFALTPFLKWLVFSMREKNSPTISKEAPTSLLILLLVAVGSYPHGKSNRELRRHRETSEQFNQCIERNDLPCVDRLLTRLPSIDAPIGTDFGPTALQLAARLDSYPVAKYLLDRGASPESGSGSHEPLPLEYAVSRGNSQMVALLIEKGAPIRTQFTNVSLIESLCWTSVGNLRVSHVEIAREIRESLKERGVPISDAEKKRCAELLTESRRTVGVPAANLQYLEQIVNLIQD